MLRFETPLFLLGLLLIPLLIVYERRRRRGFIFYSSLSLTEEANTSKGQRFFLAIPFAFRVVTFTLLFLALARPQLANVKTEVTSEGVDIILTLDTSGSMQALDFKIGGEEVDRLTAVKQVVADFVRHRVSDRMGMVVFGDMAYTQCP